MRVVSLNVWGGRVHAPLIPWLARADADVLCLQEIVHTPAADTGWLMYRDEGAELPQRANLFGEICAALPGHQAFFCVAARGELFDGERAYPSEWGLATFVRRKHPVIGQAQDFVYGGFLADGWGPHPRARNAHAVRLYNYDGGFAVTVVHLHGLREVSGKGDTPARAAQAEALVDLVGSVARKGERLVVCGDFNLLPESATFGALRAIGLTELVTAHGHSDTRTSFYARPGRFADYLLVSPEVEVRRFEVVAAPEVSDHRALVLDFG